MPANPTIRNNPARPVLFDTENENRSIYQRVRLAMLRENFRDHAVDWIRDNSGDEASQHMGIPDTALNPMASQTKQICTPGLYGRTPTLIFPDACAPLMGPDGYLAGAGIWTRNQALQYYTVGIGVYLRRINVVDYGLGRRLVDRLVPPSNVVVFVRDEDPMDPVMIWELRHRRVPTPDGEEWVYAWDMYDVSDLERPTFRVKKAPLMGGAPTDDITGLVAPELVEVYPWRRPDRKPFLPWVVYRAIDDGCFWPDYRRATHEGTFRAAEYWTYTGRTALFATGEHALIGGVDPDALPVQRIKRGDGDTQDDVQPQLSLHITPGMITFLPTVQGQQLSAVQIGPGANLPHLGDFSNQYNMMLATNEGLNPTDATRRSANPTSGAALEISAESRRTRSLQMLPLFRAADTELIQKTCWMLDSLGEHYDPTQISVQHHVIPMTPSERSDLRDDLEWQADQGQISKIEVQMRLNPGLTRDQAKSQLVKAAVDDAELQAAIDEELAAKGLEPVKPEPEPADPTQQPGQQPGQQPENTEG